VQTPSAELPEAQPQALPRRANYTGSEKSGLSLKGFPPWSHYVRLLSVKAALARAFYETEALRGAWSVRQLRRQISTLFPHPCFYEKRVGGKREAPRDVRLNVRRRDRRHKLQNIRGLRSARITQQGKRRRYMSSLKGRLVLVTGASRGVGEWISRALANCLESGVARLNSDDES